MLNEDHIDRYLLGGMEKDERLEFEARLQTDTDLRTSYLLIKDITKALREKQVLQLRDQLDRIYGEEYGTGNGKASPVKRMAFWYKTAAAAIALLVVSSLLLLNIGTERTELYQEYYQPYGSTYRVRSAHMEQDLQAQAMHHYENAEYGEAIGLFEKILDEDPDKTAAKLYLGIAYMETGSFEKSIGWFTQVMERKNSPYAEQAQWYAALSYLQAGSKDQALEALKAIAGSNGHYSKQAGQLHRKAKRLDN
jgi:predicted Zn-dependent protease